LYLSAELGKRAKAAWRKRKAGTQSDLSEGPAPGPELSSPCRVGPLRDVVRSFVLVVLPLLLVAAFIEAFITPHLR